MLTLFQVKHEPSTYWGFPTDSNNLEDVNLEKDEPLSVGVSSPPKPTDDYGPFQSDNPASRSLGNDAVRPLVHDDSWIQKRTSRWLKDLLHQPDTYTSKLTHLPGSTGRRNTVSTPGSVLWSYRKDPSTLRPVTRHSVDHRYQSTFKDLENILDNAVRLAKEAVEHVEHPESKGSSHLSATGSRYQELGSENSDRSHHEPDMRTGSIVVPVPQRISSLLRLGKVLDSRPRRASLGSSTDKSKHLPMPPPDRNIRRECPSPISHAYHENRPGEVLPNSREVRNCIRVFRQPPIHQRGSSLNLKGAAAEANVTTVEKTPSTPGNHFADAERWSLDGTPSDVVDSSTQQKRTHAGAKDNTPSGPSRRLVHPYTAPLSGQDIELQESNTPASAPQRPGVLNLRGRSHISLRGVQGFSLARSHPRQSIARDWSDGRKRYVASVACISTALIGVLVGIYAGLVPSIQYYIVDLNHYAILGNVVFYFGLAIPSFFFWPLPLLHGRKPYILSSLVIAMPLLFPQAIAVSQIRSPYTSQWR